MKRWAAFVLAWAVLDALITLLAVKHELELVQAEAAGYRAGIDDANRLVRAPMPSMDATGPAPHVHHGPAYGFDRM